jgi:hypothetical protein
MTVEEDAVAYPNSKKSVSRSNAVDLAYPPIICTRYSSSCAPDSCCLTTC